MLSRPYQFIVKKIVGLRRRHETASARVFTAAETPELLKAYEAFGRTSQSGNPRQPFKGWDLWHLLERFKPHTIVELGSGTTSAVFALWAKRNGAGYVCYEHHHEWAGVTENCLRDAGLIDGVSPVSVVASRVREDQGATGFTKPIAEDADFIYVDGPPCLLPDGRKVPNDDVVRLLDKGVLPRCIIVDGRVQTVDIIRNHAAAANYLFLPSYVYCLRHEFWSEALKGREHSLFILKDMQKKRGQD